MGTAHFPDIFGHFFSVLSYRTAARNASEAKTLILGGSLIALASFVSHFPPFDPTQHAAGSVISI